MAAIENGKTHVVVDLTAVSFVDSTVMTVLVQRRKELALRGGTLALVGLNKDLRMIFDIAGLDRALPEYGSRQAAFAAAAA
jgi:anti-sigma B factor antagonist